MKRRYVPRDRLDSRTFLLKFYGVHYVREYRASALTTYADPNLNPKLVTLAAFRLAAVLCVLVHHCVVECDALTPIADHNADAQKR